ncbi:hypothetical protein FZEAL_10396 [Fusarium zealandicum]|uniref:Uncharacterized protein n=1 Tax=Fusarium zealandicum TaxID=1053134 RepID=A0A8H4U2R3_9HYPO|nr:hypothetical protein FZEAL_10396 [Fusarium zealandicum]
MGPTILTMNQRRGLSVVFGLTFILFTVAIFTQLEEGRVIKVIQHPFKKEHFSYTGQSTYNDRFKSPSSPNRTSFEAIAIKHGSDKVTFHKYHYMYEKHVRSLQGKPVKLLEIGLGCNAALGPGASYYTWLEFLPGVDLYFIENNKRCAEQYKSKNANVSIAIGDQADPSFLKEFSDESTKDSLFDVIIDAGGHSMEQQITSLEYLWKSVKPGGLYVIEDLHTSYWEDFGGDPSARDTRKHTTMKYVFALLDDLMAGWTKKSVSHGLESADCMAQICALRKKTV